MTFRFANQRALFTYRSHLDKTRTGEIFARFGAVRVEIAHETGDPEVPYDHSHVCVEWGKAFQTRNQRFFDIDGIHPHIRILKDKRAFEDALNYISKEDPECKNLAGGTKNIVDGIWNHNSLADALRTCEKHNQIIPTIAVWKHKPIPRDILEPPKKWYEYQMDVISIIHSPKVPRKVHWFFETNGAVGKTFTGKWCEQEYGSYVVDCFGGSGNLATIIQNALQSGWNSESIIFDFPRRAEQHEIYEGLECVCNGRVTVTKYSSCVVNFRAPRLIVFANFAPIWNAMSHDRWDVWEIMPNGNMEQRRP